MEYYDINILIGSPRQDGNLYYWRITAASLTSLLGDTTA